MDLELIMTFIAGLATGAFLGCLLVVRTLWKSIKGVAALGAALMDTAAHNQAQAQAQAEADALQKIFRSAGSVPH